MNKNLTALMSLFIRVYHTKNSNIKVYNDTYGIKIIKEKEYYDIYNYLNSGIKFFDPNYTGNKNVEWIINKYIGATVIGRSKFVENHILNEIKLGLRQYVDLGCGYDTTAYKYKNKIKIYELDKENLIFDKMKRLKDANIDTSNIIFIPCDFNNDDWINLLLNKSFNQDEKTMCSLLGISYYLDKDVFFNIIKTLSDNIKSGSSIIFDYPNLNETKNELLNKKLTDSINEKMKSTYDLSEISEFASKCNLLIYEHLNNNDIYKFFYDYNTLNPNNKIVESKGVSYCLLVKH